MKLFEVDNFFKPEWDVDGEACDLGDESGPTFEGEIWDFLKFPLLYAVR